MRLALVPLILAAFLAVGPTAVHANTNQAAAERIAASLAERFPGYDIHVAYQNGKVRLVGKVGSVDNMHEAVEHVKRVPSVRVTEVDNGLQVGQGAPVVAAAPVPAAQPVQQRSVFTPQQKSIADVQVPMPKQDQKMVVVQASAQQAAQPVQPPRLQPAPIAVPQEQADPNGYYAHQHMQHGYYPQQMPQGQPMMSTYQQMPQGYPQQYTQGQPMPAMPPQQMAYHPEAYGPQGPMPGQYNHPNLPEYAWPSYACYPNYAEVCYPKQYSPKAWPYIGPFYPYPQTPLGWRRVTLEHSRGWWWLDFDNGEPSGPFSPLFREPIRYTY